MTNGQRRQTMRARWLTVIAVALSIVFPTSPSRANHCYSSTPNVVYAPPKTSAPKTTTKTSTPKTTTKTSTPKTGPPKEYKQTDSTPKMATGKDESDSTPKMPPHPRAGADAGKLLEEHGEGEVGERDRKLKRDNTDEVKDRIRSLGDALSVVEERPDTVDLGAIKKQAELTEAVARRLEEERKKREQELRDRIERLRREIEEKKKKIEKERERRERNRARDRNARRQKELKERREKLSEERYKLDEKQRGLQDERERLDNEEKRLKEEERKLRQNDPNCRSAACQENRARRAEIQSERVQNMKNQLALDKEWNSYDRENRQFNAEWNDLQKSLDRGEGLTKEEYKLRMMEKEMRSIVDERNKYFDEWSKLDNASRELARNGGKLSPRDQARMKELEEKMKGLDQTWAKGNTMTKDLRSEIRETQGGTFDDWAGYSNGNLADMSGHAAKELRILEQAEQNIGKGGPQPGPETGGLSRYNDAVENMDRVAREWNEKKAAYESEIDRLKAEQANVTRGTVEERIQKKAEIQEKINEQERLMSQDYSDAYQKYSGLEAEAEKFKDHAQADSLFNEVTGSNKDYRDLTGSDGTVSPDKVGQTILESENAWQEVQLQEDRINRLNDAAAASGMDVRPVVDAAQAKQDAALAVLKDNGMEFVRDGNGKLDLYLTTPFAGAYFETLNTQAEVEKAKAAEPTVPKPPEQETVASAPEQEEAQEPAPETSAAAAAQLVRETSRIQVFNAKGDLVSSSNEITTGTAGSERTETTVMLYNEKGDLVSVRDTVSMGKTGSVTSNEHVLDPATGEIASAPPADSAAPVMPPAGPNVQTTKTALTYDARNRLISEQSVMEQTEGGVTRVTTTVLDYDEKGRIESARNVTEERPAQTIAEAAPMTTRERKRQTQAEASAPGPEITPPPADKDLMKTVMELDRVERDMVAVEREHGRDSREFSALLERRRQLAAQRVALEEKGEEGELAQRYIAWVAKDVLPLFGDSPLAAGALPRILSGLLVRFGTRVAEQIADGSLEELQDLGTGPSAAIYSDLLLQGMAAELRMRKEADEARLADLARAEILSGVVRDPRGAGLNPDGLAHAQASLDILAGKLRDLAGAELGKHTGNVPAQMEDLSTLLLIHSMPVSDTVSPTPLINEIDRILELAKKAGQGKYSDAYLRGLMALTRSLEEGLPKITAGLEGQALFTAYRSLAEHAAEANGLLADVASAMARRGAPEAAEALRSEAGKAVLDEAGFRAKAGQFAQALQLLREMKASSPSLETARSLALIEAVNTIERSYETMSPKERQGLATPDELGRLRTEALTALTQDMSNQEMAASAAAMLARQQELRGDLSGAIKTLDTVLGGLQNPDARTMVLGKQLGLRMAKDLPDLSGAQREAALAALVNGLPDDLRLEASLLALNEQMLRGRPDLAEQLAGMLAEAAWVDPEDRPKMRLQMELARISAIGLRPPGEDTDRSLTEAIQSARARLEAATGIDDGYRSAIESSLKSVEERIAKTAAWRAAIASGSPPAEGYEGMAREALAMGQLDIARAALTKRLRELPSERLSLEPRDVLSGFHKTVQILDMVRQRMQDPSLTPQQKKMFADFLEEIGAEAARQIDGYFRERLNSAASIGGRTRPGEFGNKFTEIRAEFRMLSRLRIRAEVAALPREDKRRYIEQAREEAARAVNEKLNEIKSRFADRGQAITDDEETARNFGRAVGELNALRAARDGISDLEIDSSPGLNIELRGGNYGFLPPKTVRDSVIRALQQEITSLVPGGDVELLKQDRWRQRQAAKYSGESRRDAYINYSIREQVLIQRGFPPDEDDAEKAKNYWRDLALLENELDYLERRRAELVMEDPYHSVAERNTRYEKLLEHDATVMRQLVGPSNALQEMIQNISGFGQAHYAEAATLEAMVKANQKQALIDEFASAKLAGDAQRLFKALVEIREASLAGEIDAFVEYMNVEWYRAGPARAYNLLIGMEATQEALEAVTVEQGRLHVALIRAANNLPGQLSSDDRTLLERHGFIENGQYAIPEHLKLHPTRVASEFAAVTREGALASVDSVLNAAQAGEIIVTVAIPGGMAGRFGSVVTRELLVSGFARTFSRRMIAQGAGLVLESAAFTGLSRTARLALDPEMMMRKELWTQGALFREFAHNMAILGAMKIHGAGTTALTGRLSQTLRLSASDTTAIRTLDVFSEAAIFSGLGAALDGNAITQDDYLQNIFTVLMMRGANKAVIGAPQTPGERLVDRQVRDQLGLRQPEGTRVSQTRDTMAEYNKFIDDVMFRIQYLEQAEFLKNNFGGSWAAARSAYKKGNLPADRMRQLVEFRKRVVDRLAREVLQDLKEMDLKAFGSETLTSEDMKKMTVEAFGSENLTSDYDISFVGPKAQLAVIIFNARARAGWGRAVGIAGTETATALDTNAYTGTEHASIKTLFKGGGYDVWLQDAYAHLAARKYLDDAAWTEYRANLERSVKPENLAQLVKMMRWVEFNHQQFQNSIEAMKAELRREGETQASELDIAAQNRLYENTLREIMELKDSYEKAAGREKELLAQKIRNAQSKALYFAQEAYHTEAAIDHVVMTIQAAQRKITYEYLVDSKEIHEAARHLTRDQGRQSYVEQIANMMKELSHEGTSVELSTKAAKYFLRALDAAKIAGLDLGPYAELVKRTVDVETNRKDVNAVDALLGGDAGGRKYLGDVISATNQLTARMFGAGGR